jgi:gas vesicle protein GvpG
MDLLTLVFRLPFLPVRGLVRLAEMIRDQAEQEMHNPANVRRQLEEVEEKRIHGEVSDEDVARVEGEAVSRLGLARRGPGPDETR